MRSQILQYLHNQIWTKVAVKKVIHISKYVQGMREHSRSIEPLSNSFHASQSTHSRSYKLQHARLASLPVHKTDANSMKSTLQVNTIHINKKYAPPTVSMPSGMNIADLAP